MNDNISDIISESIDGIIFDLDGVIWRGKELISGAREAILKLRMMDKKILFVTNNASETRSYQHTKLCDLGIECSLEEVLTSGYGAAKYLKENHPSDKVYVMGTPHLEEEVRNQGLELTNIQADIVLVGFDREFSYKKLNIAFESLYQRPSKLIACNKNAIYPHEKGFSPGIGPSVAALEYAIGRVSDVTIGKPHQPLLDAAMSLLGTTAKRSIVFGDILDMDISWGISGGLQTCYVLSGVGTREDISTLKIQPTYVAESVAHAIAGQ